MDFEKQLLEENGHYIDVSPTVSVHNISHILDALDILLINHGNEIHSETAYGGYGFYNPITGEKLIEEGKSYYLESDNEVVVFEQNEQMINQFYRNNVYQLTDGRIKDKLIHRKKDNRNIAIATNHRYCSISIINKICQHVTTSHLPEQYGGTNKYRLITDIIREYFQPVMAEFSKVKEIISSLNIPVGLNTHPVYKLLMEVIDDINDFVAILKDKTPRLLCQCMHYRGYLLVINYGDFRIVEWELMKMMNVDRATSVCQDDSFNASNTSMISAMPQSITLNILDSYLEMTKKECLVKYESLLLTLM